MLYGYHVSNGYKGRLEDGSFMLFPTEQEYVEYFKEVQNDRKAERSNQRT